MLWFTILCACTWIISSLATLEINIKQINESTLPPANDTACMARYVVHYSNWCTLSYIAKKNASISGAPLGRIYSVSDGIPGQSTGIVFFMVSPLDLTVQDLMVQNNCSVTMSLAESNYCSTQQWDPQDPRCAQVILNGNIVTVPSTSSELDYVKNALWTRHPAMHTWYINVPSHKWFFAKLVINHIEIVDTFGGRKFPSIYDYFYKKCGPYLNNSMNVANFQTDMSFAGKENVI